MSESFQTIQVRHDPSGILEITLNRPEIRNAFNEVMIQELKQVFAKNARAPGVRLVVFKGEGAVFCAGGDLNWMKRSIELDYSQNLEDTRALTDMFATINECPVPIIAAVQGAAIGGGVGMVSVCDIVLATEETQFSLSEVRLGIVPACIGPFVVAKIGASHARRFFTSAERFLAPQAKEIGLVHEVYKDAAALNEGLNKLTKGMLQCGPNAMAVAKRLVLDLSWPERRVRQPDCLDYVAKVLAEIRISSEGQEGVKAFLEKRKPNWLV